MSERIRSSSPNSTPGALTARVQPSPAASAAAADTWLPMGRPGDRRTDEAAGQHRSGRQAVHEARAYLSAHKAAYQQALAALSPDERAQVVALQHGLASRPQGQAALVKLLVSGQLHEPVLANLDRMSRMPLARGIARADLLESTLNDLAQPDSIVQGIRASCESATSQSLLARSHPAEYTRLLVGLASPGGQVPAADGKHVLTRPADWHAQRGGLSLFVRFFDWITGHGSAERSTTGQLFQPTFANLAMVASHGAGYRYDNRHDCNLDPHGQTYWNTDRQDNGITNAELATALTAVTGRPYAYTTRDLLTSHDSGERQRAARAVYRGLAQGEAVPIVIADGNPQGGHDVLALPADGDRIHIFNPSGGKLESMSRAQFEAIVYSAIAPEAPSTTEASPDSAR